MESISTLPLDIWEVVFRMLDLETCAKVAIASRLLSTHVWRAQRSITVKSDIHAQAIFNERILTNLINITQFHTQDLLSLKYLTHMTKLESLQVSSAPHNLNVLAHITSMRTLLINGYTGNIASVIKDIGKFTNLEHLRLPIGGRSGSCDALQPLQKLRQLELNTPVDVSKCADFIRLSTSLRVLGFHTQKPPPNEFLYSHLTVLHNNQPVIFSYLKKKDINQILKVMALQPGCVNWRREDGKTPLMMVRDWDTFELLVKAGADIYATVTTFSNGKPIVDTVLTLVLKAADLKLASQILRICEDPKKLASLSDPHALLVAMSIKVGSQEEFQEWHLQFINTCFQLIPEWSSFSVRKNNTRWTLLHEALSCGNVGILSYLMDGYSPEIIAEWANSVNDFGQTPLHVLCSYASARPIIAKLLSFGCNLHLETGLGHTALDVALQHGRLEVVQVLLERDSPQWRDELLANNRGSVVMAAACKALHIDIIRRLFELAGDKVADFFIMGLPPALAYAVKFRWLLRSALSLEPPREDSDDHKKEIPVKLLLNTSQAAQKAAIWAMCNADDGETVKLLLKAGANPNYGLNICTETLDTLESMSNDVNVKSVDFGLDYPLIRAVRISNIHMVETLLDAGADVNVLGRKGASALSIAISKAFSPLKTPNERNNALEIVWMLLKAGADPTLASTPSASPISRLSARVAELFGLDDIQSDFDSARALAERIIMDNRFTECSQSCNVLALAFTLKLSPQTIHKLFQTSLKHIGCTQHLGNTPLHLLHNVLDFCWPDGVPHMENEPFVAWVTRQCISSMPQYLNSGNQNGDTPLICAARANALPIVAVLLEQKEIDVDKTNSRGETALRVACASVSGDPYDMVKLLLDSGANPNTPVLDLNPYFTPLQAAAETNRYDVVKLLLERGASTARVDLLPLVASPTDNGLILFELIERMPGWRTRLNETLEKRLREKIKAAGVDELSEKLSRFTITLPSEPIDTESIFGLPIPAASQSKVKDSSRYSKIKKGSRTKTRQSTSTFSWEQVSSPPDSPVKPE